MPFAIPQPFTATGYTDGGPNRIDHHRRCAYVSLWYYTSADLLFPKSTDLMSANSYPSAFGEAGGLPHSAVPTSYYSNASEGRQLSLGCDNAANPLRYGGRRLVSAYPHLVVVATVLPSPSTRSRKVKRTRASKERSRLWPRNNPFFVFFFSLFTFHFYYY